MGQRGDQACEDLILHFRTEIPDINGSLACSFGNGTVIHYNGVSVVFSTHDQNMSYEPYAAAAGAILGSLVEEGLEEVFPGLGELAYTGEAGGAITGLLATGLAEEKREAIKSFVKYAYREVNDAEIGEEIPKEEIDAFSENFDEIPRREKEKIINHYRNVAPHEYHLIKEFIQEN